MAAVHGKVLVAHGHERIDPYYWLRDDAREDEAVLAYLKAENSYTNQAMAPQNELRETLFKELGARLKPDDESVPYHEPTGWYAKRYVAGKELPIHVRWPAHQEWPQGDPEVLLDENQLGEGYDFYQIGNYAVGPDGRWLAWAEDTVSRGIYTIRFRDLNTGNESPETLEHAAASLAFAADGETVFYLRLQQETLIPWQVWRHRIGSPAAEDVLVYEESDASYYNALERSRDGRWIVLYQNSTTTSQTQIISTRQPDEPIRPVIPRSRGHEYQVDFLDEQAFILTNQDAVNFRVVSVALARASDRRQWREVVAHRDDVLLSDAAVFRQHLVVEEIDRGIQKLRVMPLNGQGQSQADQSFHIQADEPAYTASLDVNPTTETHILRYAYTSLATPTTVYDVDLVSGEKIQRKQAYAGDDFDASRYALTRIEIDARDGAKVPVTLLHQAGSKPDGHHPLYLKGYGSYGFSYLPGFSANELSLVDRGFVTAIAHIRGGQEMGRRWYEDGKLLNKKNTFTDFIDVAQALVDQGWADREKVVAAGRSAGGLLIGAVANMAPETFAILIAGVPFVDVVTTMLDESIPLTTYEYDEWGNPQERAFYDYMLSYSPYDQVAARDYPHILVTTGLWDPAVQYWEPAKWVAKLRTLKTDRHELLFYTDMSAGHRGGAGRFERLRDRALEYAFILSRI